MSSIAVAAPSVLASEAGRSTAEAGGSAVDVAIAATLTAMCSEPGVCAPGGGGYLTVAPSDDDPVTVDGSMAMPGLGLDPARPIHTRTVSMEYGGGITTEVGPGSIAVPGAFAAMAVAHRRWGRLPWAEVIGLVADVLEEGFPLPASCAYYLGYSGASVFGVDPASRRALHDGDRLLGSGEIVHVDDMTDTLRQIATEGAETFYRGELAVRIAADMEARGSRLTRQDLETYRALVRPALVTDFGPWTIATNPPPAVGGVTVTAILRALDEGRRSDAGAWAEAQHRVFALREERYAGGADSGIGWEFLDSFPVPPRTRSGSTVSISVAEEDGIVCASTMSGGYGSGVIPSGTGLWMNNSLGERELNPGGVDGTRPGERLLSNMAPTVALGPGRRLAIGSPGAERITSALSAALALVMEGADLHEAIEHPRCHVELDRGTVAHEPGIEPDGPLPGRPFPALDMYFGGVTGAETGRLGVAAHADSRRTGGVAIVHTERRHDPFHRADPES